MTTRTIQTGDRTITITDDGPPPLPGMPESGIGHEPRVVVRDHQGIDFGSFVVGMLAELLLLWLMQRRRAIVERRRERDEAMIGVSADRMAAEVAALARRTATLETIVTDPGQRTARAIDALR